MSDEAGRFTAEHTVMDKNLEIREQTHLLEVRDKRIDDLLKENQHLELDTFCLFFSTFFSRFFTTSWYKF